MIRNFIVTAAVVCGLAGGAAAQPEPAAGTVLATVNGTDITLGHVVALISRLPAQYRQLPDEQLFGRVMDQLIRQTALASGMNRGRKSVALAIENQTRALLAAEKLASIENGAVTEAGLQAAYDDRYGSPPAVREWKPRHILVATGEEAQAIVAALEGGADFGELAREKSTGPSGPSGGDLGWQRRGALVPAFETAMMALEPGDVSAPVRTRFGWHVIRLDDVREQPGPPLDEVRADLAAGLKEAAVRAALDGAVRAAEVVRSAPPIDLSVIRNLDLLKDQAP
ncbi:MAG: peptidylprolyl isomerase [Rhodobacteraceae bacterium]|nr:peptidylprolyl isomerase [Paracoccaceae bacterium]